jgi:hypothetical protein
LFLIIALIIIFTAVIILKIQCVLISFPISSIYWILGAVSQGITRKGREADHTPPSSADVKNVGTTPPLPHTFSWRGA